jgi:hypothetical protein
MSRDIFIEASPVSRAAGPGSRARGTLASGRNRRSEVQPVKQDIRAKESRADSKALRRVEVILRGTSTHTRAPR